ncbi:alpha/beta hydrolase [Paenibacillus sp. Aloe-11]|uniref:alpha/beta hydrolase n=1 Tax=Paenibacillus sp. Aloe-11 TaxID=1050222 RepID=UPI00024F01B9|nr:alpha/beta hydrolase-fold protein [Paenibacillus sp. Aloe-11]EHS55814.1 esterase [Paenibacillus sp. Aloe-11]
MRGHIDDVVLDDYLLHIYTPPASVDHNGLSPVLYVQDGSSLFLSSLDELERRFITGEIPPVVLVGIQPVNRLDDYTPWQAAALVEGRPAFGGGGDAYLAFIVTQVMPYVEAEFPVQTGLEHTGIIGASLGGLISMYAAFRYADVFGRIGSISGSYWYPGMIGYMQSASFATGAAGTHQFYVSVGTREGEGKTNVQKDMVSLTLQAREALLGQGLDEKDVLLVLDEDAVHRVDFFQRQFLEAIKWLFR